MRGNILDQTLKGLSFIFEKKRVTMIFSSLKVASFGGFLLKENIMTLSFAPRDSHKSQIQFALERGIPAFLLMLGTRRLPFPAQSFDFIHCSRCLIPFTAYSKYFSSSASHKVHGCVRTLWTSL